MLFWNSQHQAKKLKNKITNIQCDQWKFYCVFWNIFMCYCFISVRYQQILFHLSQITPRRHTIRLKESKSNRKVNKTTTKTEYERLCQESLCEALRNFQASTNTAILEIPVSTITKQKPLVRSYPQTNSAIKCLDRLENTIKLSYVSRNSFAENKAEPMFHDRHEYAGNAMNHPNTVLLAANLIRQLSQPIFRNSIQIRGFKTHRTIASQLKRNPSFVSRFQQFFGECMLGVKIGRASNNNCVVSCFSSTFQSRFSNNSIKTTTWDSE